MPDVLKSILTQAGLAIAPFGAIKTKEQAVAFFNQLGYNIPGAAFGSALTDLSTQAGELASAARTLSNAEGDAGVAAAIANLFGRLVATVNAVSKLHAELKVNPSIPALPPIDELPVRLTDFLVLDFMDKQKPNAFRTFHFLGLIEHDPAAPSTGQPMRKINFDRFGTLFNKPGDLFETVYKWKSGFDSDLLLQRLEAIMRAASLPGGLYPGAGGLKELRFPMLQKGTSPETYMQFGITLAPTNGTPKGISLSPYLMGTSTFQFEVCERGEVLFNSTADIRGVGIKLLPPLNAEPNGLNGAFRSSIEVREKASHTEEIILVGSKGGSRLSVQGLGSTWFIQNAGGKLDLGLEGQLKAVRLVIKGGEGDGFLNEILSGVNLTAESSLTFGYSWLAGFYLKGGAKLAIDLPIHIEQGPVKISGLRLALMPTNGKFTLQAGVNIGLQLGPMKAVVQNIGVEADIKLERGNMGPLDLSIRFKPPEGLGLSIDAGLVKGGGYLGYFPDKEEYAGVLELSIVNIVTVKAIGIITTRFPDGTSGFSLLLIITTEFGTGIQLGFGFTLLGVGGLLGLNRTMQLEPLASGMRTGAINSVMFPPDPVANAPRIISDIRLYFPPEKGKFLIGPMAMFGWGTPTLISIAFGLIIEIPGNIAIVGKLRIVMPEENAPIMVMNVAFVGALEFDKNRIWFFAVLYDSRILFMTMEGEMGLLMDYGDNPNFVLTVGGFHPQFNPPSLPFPSPRRIHIDILRTPLARITAENYFAVTSNTVQLGARAEFFYGIDDFNLHGHLGFDAIFYFNPFRFLIEISFSLAMEVFGAGVFSVQLKLTLSGPAPWNARGTAYLSIDLWLFSIDIPVDFNITWGEANNPTLPPVDALWLLGEEFKKKANWKAKLPVHANLLVSLRKLEGKDDTLVLHPLGTLRISQMVMPLGVKVDKVGNKPVGTPGIYNVAATAGLAVAPNAPVERFAMAQFQEMSEADKLSRPSFQEAAGGVELKYSGERQYVSKKVVKRVVRYDVKIRDGDDKYTSFRWFKNIGFLFRHWLNGAAVAKCTLSQQYKKNMVPTLKDERVKVGQPGFVVAGTDNNRSVGPGVFSSEALARDFLNEELRKNPNKQNEIHIIPSFEAIDV